MAGFWQNLLSSFRGGNAFITPNVQYLSAGDFASMADPSRLTAAQMWRTQPHFRTVVTFLARNIAQLGLHSFERVDDTDRRRDRVSPLARALFEVDGQMTTHELIFSLVGDLALYDRAYWWAAPSSEMSSGWMIRRIPPTWITPKMSNPFEVGHYELHLPDRPMQKLSTDQVLAFPGFDPTKASGASPTVDALRQVLQEQVEAAVYRAQTWKRGGRVSSVIERPKDAPSWSPEAMEQFREDWYSKYTGRGSKAGGTPILEDGMTLKRIDFNAQEQQYVEAAKLSLVTVAAAFHINPTMVGQNDGANYSNVREFRKMLYGDTLGPLIAQIEDRINTFLVPRMGLDPATHYVEFNIDEKLQGNFEETSVALQSATGGPWMTRNEARALRNLPALEGGDQLVVPLNVLEGGQASPHDSGSQNTTGQSSAPGVRAKARAGAAENDHALALAEFFTRQGSAVRSALGRKADAEWWDAGRWDAELADVLLSLSTSTSEAAARRAIEQVGLDPDDYSTEQTRAFLSAVASREAEAINGVTKAQVEQALSEEEPMSAVAKVFVAAASVRAVQAAATLVTQSSGFGTVEAGKQLGRGFATKTWVVTSSNPRDSHARMNGETVGIEQPFSNGLDYPAVGGDPDEVANCRCEVSMFIP